MSTVKDYYNLGIIGFGGMAGNHYKQLSKGNTKVKIKGVWDIDPKRLDAAREKGLKAYGSEAEIMNDPDIDIILVAATNEVHKDIAISALKNGKHVLCEKPATMTSDELTQIMEAAEKYDRVFTVDQNRRTNRDFVLMRRTVESGIIGKPYVIESRVEGSRGVPAGWRTQKEKGGGMMLDWGVHLIDQMLYMFSEKVTNVFCKMYSVNYPEVDDNLRLTMTFESGLTAHMEVSTNNFIQHPRWYVLGHDGTLQIDDWACNGKVVRCLERQDKWADEIKTVKAGPTKTMAPRTPDTVETIELSEPTDVVDNLDVVYRQMVDAIEGKAELTIKPEQALRVMRVMEAAFESAESGNAIHTDI
ncbi:MAG: Gfo/Idh/MocA family oxidoreductase [Clostridiales bacterium]|nr:Gfo/Idh/MocA family oxidoreductase [Clostridiales bacterium]